MGSRHAVPRPPRSRVGIVLATLATACGLWFGITAPDVSPVAPPAPPVASAPVAEPGGTP